MAKFYALYLPQFHPIPENDEWYGKGFTEWRSVASAKPLYPGHYQPHIPADLGFYDLRLKETVLEQIKYAKEYGIDGFCYWHYWFGDGKQLLETPFYRIVKDKSINFSFAAAWGNASWFKKQWGAKGQDRMLIQQQYLGKQDYTDHFYSLLEAFKDKRYIRVDGKLLFIIYQPTAVEEIADMIKVWRKLAAKEGLNDFFFVGHDLIGKNRKLILERGFDAVYDDNMLNIHHQKPKFLKALWQFERKYLHIPTIFRYKKAIQYMITKEDYQENIFPVVVPNWDHTPRTGTKNIMFRDCKPEYFKQLVKLSIDAIKDKPAEKQIVIVKSWNEWGEGNHMEPDLRYGRGYLEALKQARDEADI
jgi:lipopolysaccharide biosynthesis protein